MCYAKGHPEGKGTSALCTLHGKAKRVGMEDGWMPWFVVRINNPVSVTSVASRAGLKRG